MRYSTLAERAVIMHICKLFLWHPTTFLLYTFRVTTQCVFKWLCKFFLSSDSFHSLTRALLSNCCFYVCLVCLFLYLEFFILKQTLQALNGSYINSYQHLASYVIPLTLHRAVAWDSIIFNIYILNMHCAVSWLCFDIIRFKSQVCANDKEPECFVGNATLFQKSSWFKNNRT